MMPAGTYTSQDTVDIRIAEQVKEPAWPSLASVFDLTQTKGNSNFPRTAAPAQVGSLPLRGRDVYTVKFTGSDTGNGRDITAITFDPSGTVASPLTVPERNTGQDTGIGILVERTETADEGRIMLQIARTAGTNNDGVSIRVGGASGDVSIPADGNVNLMLVIEAGQSSQQITAKVEGNDNGATGNRIYTFTLDGNDQTQDFTAPAIQLTIEDDDDEAAVLAKGASPESAVGQTEAGLQTGSVRIDSGAEVTEGNDVDGVAQIIIDVDILRADGVSRDIPSPGNYLSTNGRNSILESVSINYSVDTVSNDLVVTLNLSGSAQDTLDQAQALVRALNFFLPASDRDIGDSATVSISLVPPSSAGNTTPSTQTYTIGIAPENDTDYTVVTRTIEVDELEEGGGSGVSTVTILTGVSAVESGETIGVSITDINNSNSELFRVDPSVTLSGGVVDVGFTLNLNQDGEYRFSLLIADSGGNATVSGFSINVVGLPDAIDEDLITIDFSDLAPGARAFGDDYILVQGTDEMTMINVDAVTCVANTACDSVSASIDRVEMAGSVALGSFGPSSNRVRWTARNSAGVDIAITTRTIYVAPLVGFNVRRARFEEGGSVNLPVSVAVSPDVTMPFTVNVGIDGRTFNFSSRRNIIQVSSVGDVTMTLLEGSLAPSFPANLSSTMLYTVGNSVVTVSELPAPSMEEPEFAFSPKPPLFIDDSASALPGFSIMSSPEAVMYEITALISNREIPPLPSITVNEAQVTTVNLSFEGGIQAGDIIEVKASSLSLPSTIIGSFFVVVLENAGSDANENGIPDGEEAPDLQSYELPVMGNSRLDVSEGTVALGGYAALVSSRLGEYSAAAVLSDTTVSDTINIGTPPGYPMGAEVFDFIVNNIPLGGQVSVRIPLQRPVSGSHMVFKYDDGWNQFISNMPADAYYSAPLPCPSLGASRDGDGRPGAWRPADNGLMAGHGCLLLEITDGGPNDADGTRNGVIYDPDSMGGGGGGGGAMEPIWLILLALAMVLPYGLRRRQSSSFISDL